MSCNAFFVGCGVQRVQAVQRVQDVQDVQEFSRSHIQGMNIEHPCYRYEHTTTTYNPTTSLMKGIKTH